jgi:ubiquinone/menaquinone biosynthesis C-methylase UbiE
LFSGSPIPRLAAVNPFSIEAVRAAYDAVAGEYADVFGDDLARLPVDRTMLDKALTAAGRDAWVLDLGCGPAPAAGHLAGRASRLLGIDLSRAMLTAAGDRVASLRRTQADMRRLPLQAGSCGLVIAYYSLQHLERNDLGLALAEIHRVLRRDGWLLVATHLGEGEVLIDEFLGHRVTTFAGAFHRREELLGLLAASGFRLEDECQREPLPHEYDSRRIYLLAQSHP